MSSLSILVISAIGTIPALASADLETTSLFAKPMTFWRDHILRANVSHFAGGFGLAVLLQRYLAGRPAAKALGWFLLAFALATHLIAFI
jgi:hypothetical protein